MDSRDTSGAISLGFAVELSQTHACCFAMAIGSHLSRTRHRLRQFSILQIDNGCEFLAISQQTRDNRDL